MPFPNEHAARITDPGQYEKFARKNIAPGIDIILGIKADKSETQSYRFDKTKFTPAEAKAWLKDHNESPISFEPAAESASAAPESKQTFNVDDKEVFRTGTWKGKTYTTKDLDVIVSAYQDLKDKIKIPLKLGHSADQTLLQQDGFPAAGWITNLKRVGDRLIASFKDVPRKVKEFIERGGYSQVSSEIWNNVKFNNKEYTKMLMGVALLGADVPAVIGLNDFGEFYTNYLDGQDKNIFTIEVKSGGEEYAMGTEMICNKCGKKYTMDETNKNGRNCPMCASPDVSKITIKENNSMSDLKVLEQQIEQYKADIKAKDDAIQALTKESQDAKDTVMKFTSEKRSGEIREFIELHKKEGRILPANESLIQSIMENCSNESKIKFSANGKEEEVSLFDAFKNMVSSLPNIVKFAEKSAESAAEDKEEFKANPDLGNEIEQKIHFFTTKYMAEHKDVTYETAMVQVKKDHPELTEQI